MAWRSRRRWARYSRNYGNEWSKSANAQNAEDNGRYPRTRAAANLGVSVKAFDSGVRHAGITTNEWHHVGKYATMIDYWDTEICRENAQFWRGAALAYKAVKRIAELQAKAEILEQAENVVEFPETGTLQLQAMLRPLLNTAGRWRHALVDVSMDH